MKFKNMKAFEFLEFKNKTQQNKKNWTSNLTVFAFKRQRNF